MSVSYTHLDVYKRQIWDPKYEGYLFFIYTFTKLRLLLKLFSQFQLFKNKVPVYLLSSVTDNNNWYIFSCFSYSISLLYCIYKKIMHHVAWLSFTVTQMVHGAKRLATTALFHHQNTGFNPGKSYWIEFSVCVWYHIM